MRGLRVAEAAWPEVEAALQAGHTGILPVGAAAKEHGRHLPMNTDYVQAEWLAARLVERLAVAAWPTLGYGHYPAFLDYPGSCSLGRATFTAAAAEILDNLLHSGARRVLILNTGISTIPPLEDAIGRCRQPRRVGLANVYAGPQYRAARARIAREPRGGHAGEAETSIMLAIAPERVRMDRADACTRQMQPGPLRRRDAAHPNYSPSGVWGDPRLASREQGEVLLRAMLEDLTALLAAPWPEENRK